MTDHPPESAAPLQPQPPPIAQARFVTLDHIMRTIVPRYWDPPIGPISLKRLLQRAKVPKMKMGSPLRRGGGRVYYSLDAVERVFRTRMPGLSSTSVFSAVTPKSNDTDHHRPRRTKAPAGAA